MNGMLKQPSIEVRGELRYAEPLSRHTSWRVGGPAERFFRPRDLRDLMTFLSQLPVDEPLFWLGLGSNLLVRDGGIRGTVICTRGLLNEMAFIEGGLLRVEAGVSCAKVARFSAQQGFSGGEFLAGIPGTMGGALAMNAGAFGGETWDWVAAVETVDRRGRHRLRQPADYRVGYRSVSGPEGEWFVAAHLRFERGQTQASQRRVKQLLARRSETQPLNLPSCGSVFRNPPQDFAARLIEQAGMKGVCVGQACVSEKHANFIVNRGGARASDIEQLIQQVREAVRRSSGVLLETEVHIVGEPDGEAVDG